MVEEQPVAPPTSNRKGVGCLIALVLVAAALYSCGRLAQNSASREPEVYITRPNGEKVDEFLALVWCERQIKDLLVSPSTAKFGRSSRQRVGNTWVVALPLDSQNSFGAMIRSEWTCVVDGTSDRVTVNQER